MEEQWQVDRARLRRLSQAHPTWSQSRLAQETKRSVTWVKKWRKRFGEAAPGDQDVLKSRSRRPKQAGSPIQSMVIERILAIRDHPPLNRIPGPLAIQYFLEQQEKDDPLGCYLPTSSSTIWRILEEHQRIYRPTLAEPEPLPLAEPMENWQIDFKDVITVRRPEQEIKQQHFVQWFGHFLNLLRTVRQNIERETTIRMAENKMKAIILAIFCGCNSPICSESLNFRITFYQT